MPIKVEKKILKKILLKIYFSFICKTPTELNKPIIEFQGIKKLLHILRNAEKELLNKHDAIRNVPYNGIAETEFERIYINNIMQT